MMEAPSGRSSDRVSMTLLLEISGRDKHGQDFKDPARTLLISRHGAVIVLARELAADQPIFLQRRAAGESHRHGNARVVGQLGSQHGGYLYGVEIVDQATDLWGVEFPPIANSNEAVARMLLQCCYCRTREVIYLNEMELRAFETNRGIARFCKICSMPSIWTQAPQEDEKKHARVPRTRRVAEPEPAPPSHGQRERQKIRLKTRLTACIRHEDSDDELAVCEDISPIGVCFRSKRRYETGMQVDIAVPYSPDSANIFLPARIVYSEELPKAGLFRHGTEFNRVGPPKDSSQRAQ